MMKTRKYKSLKKIALAALVASPFAVATVAQAQAVNVTIGTINAADTIGGGNHATIGNATVTQTNATTVTVNVTQDRSVLTWQDFDIVAGNTANFTLPTASSAVLNRVIAGNGSTIAGSLTSNGKVFLQNPQAIVISGTAVINTAEFMASTRNETSGYFQANGTLELVGNTAAGVTVNTGAQLTGNITLVGNAAQVAGTVTGNLVVKTTAQFGGGGDLNLGTDGNLTVSGDLTLQSGGQAVDLTDGANTVTVSGDVSVTTVHGIPGTAAGAVSQGAAGTFLANGATKTVTINTSGDVGATVRGHVTLGAGGSTFDAKTLMVTGRNVSVTEAAGSADLTVTGINATGTVNLVSNSNTASSGSNLMVTGSVTGVGGVVVTSTNNELSVTGAVTNSTGGGVALTSTAKSLTVSGGVSAAGGLTLDANTSIALSGTNTVTGGAFTVDGGAGAVEDSLSITGTVSVASNNIVIQNLPSISITGGLTTTTAGNITIAKTVAAGTLTVGNSITSAGNLTISNTSGDIQLGNLTVGGDLSVATTTAAAGSISMIGSSVANVTGNVALDIAAAAAGKTITFAGGTAQTVDLTTLNNNNAAAGAVTITAGKAINFNTGGDIVVPNLTATTTAEGISFGAGTAYNLAAGVVALNSATNTVLRGVTGTTLTVTTTNGTITQAAGNVVVSGTTTLNAGGTAGQFTLTTAGNDFALLKLVGGAAGTNAVTDSLGSFTLANGTAVTGSATVSAGVAGVTAGSIDFGAANNDTITFANVTFNAFNGGTITASGAGDSANVTLGDVTFNTENGNVTLNGNGATNNLDFGKITADLSTAAGGAGVVGDTANLTIIEKQAVSLGAIEAEVVAVTSLNGGITQASGNPAYIAIGTSTFTAAAASDIVLNSTGNVLDKDNDDAVDLTIGGATNLTFVEGGANDIVMATSGAGVSGIASFTMTGNALTVGTGAAGDAKLGTFSYTNNGNGAVTVNDDDGGLTVANFGYTGNTAARGVVTINATAGALVLGSGIDSVGLTGVPNTLGNTSAHVFGSGAGSITQTAAVKIGGATTFNAVGGVLTLNTTGNTFGSLTLNNGGSANAINVKQSGNLDLTLVTGGTGALTVVSETGNVTDVGGGAITAGATTIIAGDTDGTGSITLNNGVAATVASLSLTSKGTTGDIVIARGAPGVTGNLVVVSGRDVTSNAAVGGAATFTAGRNITQTGAVTGNIEITSANNVTLNNAATAVKLGNFDRVNGTLNITTTAAAGVVLQNEKRLIVIGDTTITTNGGNGTVDLRVKNSSGSDTAETARGTIGTGTYNNFGGVTINAGTAAVSINEGNTLRLLGITTSGTAFAESFWGSIIDTNPSTMTGATTLIATQGAVTLDHHNNVLRNVKVVTDLFNGNDGAGTNTVNGNVYLSTIAGGGAGFIMAAGTKVGGTYTLVGDGTVNGGVTDNGTLKIYGDVTIDTQSSAITLDDNVSTFGGIQFKGAAVSIYENAGMRIRGGSSATGAVTLSCFGAMSFTTDLNCNFQNNVSLTAFGAGNTITIPNTFYMTGAGMTLTVNTNSAAEKKLGGLSTGINLNGNTVVYIGGAATGTDAPGL